MKAPKFILPLVVIFAISASGAPGSAGTGTPLIGSAPNAPTGLNRPNTSNPLNPNLPQQQPGNVPQQPIPNNNVGNSTFIQPGGASSNNVGNGKYAQPGFVSSNNIGNGTFIQSRSTAQPGSPAVGPQNMVTNSITGQNTNQTGMLGTNQPFNQSGGMTNNSPLQTNNATLQQEMTNTPP